MTRRLFRYAVLLAAVSLGPLFLHAQYYDQGRSATNIRWKQSWAAPGKIVYPDYYQRWADRIGLYLDTLTPHIGYGFSQPPLRLPIVLYTENMQSNGLVLWAPKRMELLTIPDQKTYAEPWLKQLTAHEYRHAVQYGNLYQGFMKPLGWFIGQHSGLISSALLPLWFLEGDATMAETQFSEFGRALQPSFTIEYRAYLTEGTPRKFRVDKWFCGSYVHFLPDHYQLGYQLTAYSREKYGDDMWDPVAKWVSKYPYSILTTHFSLEKYYKTSTNKLFRETFAELETLWKSMPQTPNSGTLIPTRITSYTTYDSPMPLNDSTLLAFKRDLDRPNRLVAVDLRTARERMLAGTGTISTPPVLSDSTVWWTEFRNDLFWDRRVFSKVCSYDLRTGRRAVVRERRNALYATPLPGGSLATVGYDYSGHYTLEFSGRPTIDLPDSLSVHGMAYDELTGTLALLGLSDRGMAFYKADTLSGALSPLTVPNRSSVYNLRAGDGRLSYNSIQSGKDEVHLYDLRQGREYRLTDSRYGSFSPSAPSEKPELYFTTYTREGYRLARQEIKADSLHPVPYARLPLDVVNPSRRRWGLRPLDSVATPEIPDSLPGRKPFRKGGHLVNMHSWLPASINPYEIAQENQIEINLGATVMSQNLLSNTDGYLSYGYSHRSGHMAGARIDYGGLPPKFEIEVDFHQKGQLLYGWTPETGVPEPALGHYVEAQGNILLPMQLSSGYHLRALTPHIELNYLNAKVYSPERKTFTTGLVRMAWALDFADQVRMGYRDFLPRWGYLFQGSGALAPLRSDFGTVYTLYGKAYLPGVARHHSLMLRGALQTQNQDIYNFYSKKLYPRGCDYNAYAATRYASWSVDYQLPLCYPDWGITSIFYLNRIRLNAYYDRARYRGLVNMNTGDAPMHTAFSYGGEITFDMRVLRMPVNDTSIGVYVYKPNDRRGVEVGAHVSLPL